MIRVWFAICEEGEWLVESDVFEAATGAEALAKAETDYPGCRQYSLTELSA